MSFLQGMGIAINAGKDIERQDRADRMAGMQEEQARQQMRLQKIRQYVIAAALQRQQERAAGAQGGAKFGGLYDDAKAGEDLPSIFSQQYPMVGLTPLGAMGLQLPGRPTMPEMGVGQGVRVPQGFADGGPVRVPPNTPNGVVNTGGGVGGFAPAAGAMPPWIQGYMGGGRVSGPGTATSDSIPARLSDGEFVIPADVVRRKGTEFFDKLIAGGKNGR